MKGAGASPTSALEPKASPRSSLRGFIYIGVAALFWGMSASLGRAAFNGHLWQGGAIRNVDPLILSQCRTSFSFLAVALGLLLRRGVKRLELPWIDFAKLVLLGLGGVAVSNYFYYLAIQRTNVATAIIVQYTAPVWVLVYMVVRRAERLTATKLFSVLLAVAGIVLVIGLFGQSSLRFDRLGVAAALVAAFSFSYYNVGGHQLLLRYDRWMVLLYTTLAASVFWIAVNPPSKIIAAHYPAPTWLFLAGFSFLSVLLPFTLYFAGLECLVPTKAVIVSCLEPVFAILIAAVALKEIVAPLQTLGIAMVLSAIVMTQRPGPDIQSIPGPID